MTITASQILLEANELVIGDRQKQNGDKHENFEHIAQLWNCIIQMKKSQFFDAHDVANMMELMKIARRYSGEFNIDDYVDGAGYAACAFEISNNNRT